MLYPSEDIALYSNNLSETCFSWHEITIRTAQTISRPYAPMSRKNVIKKVIIKQERIRGKTILLKLWAVSLFFRFSEGSARTCEHWVAKLWDAKNEGSIQRRRESLYFCVFRVLCLQSCTWSSLFLPGFTRQTETKKRETACSLTVPSNDSYLALSHPCYYLP